VLNAKTIRQEVEASLKDWTSTLSIYTRYIGRTRTLNWRQPGANRQGGERGQNPLCRGLQLQYRTAETYPADSSGGIAAAAYSMIERGAEEAACWTTAASRTSVWWLTARFRRVY